MMATKKTGRKVGRPTKFNAAVAAKVVDRIGAGEYPGKICKGAGMPDVRTVNRWRAEHPDFAQQYAQARTRAAEFEEDRVALLRDMLLAGLVDSKDAAVALNATTWLAKVRDPATYADRQRVDVAAIDGMTPDELRARAAVLFARLPKPAVSEAGGEGVDGDGDGATGE